MINDKDILKDIAENDPDENIRQEANKKNKYFTRLFSKIFQKK